MLTLQKIRQIVGKPEERNQVPTAKYLQDRDIVVISKCLGIDAGISVYRSGYAMYRIGKYTTVFSVHACGDYFYQLSGRIICIQESYFNFQEWYVRLILEGEDRICHNRELQEYEKVTSYDTVSEAGMFRIERKKSPLEQIIQDEVIRELVNLLTERQRQVIIQFFFWQKTQNEIAKELGLTQSTVSIEISKAIHKMQKHQFSSELNL